MEYEHISIHHAIGRFPSHVINIDIERFNRVVSIGDHDAIGNEHVPVATGQGIALRPQRVAWAGAVGGLYGNSEWGSLGSIDEG